MRAIPILTYHSIDASGSVVSVAPAAFAEQMRHLADGGWRGISLREAVAFHQSNGSWPDGCAALTFDDGYENFYDDALPVLLQHGFTATVFVVSGHMGRTNEWEIPPAGLGVRPILSWQQAAEIAAAGIEVGSHTKTHPDLRRLPRERIEEEFKTSRAEIEDHVGGPVESFAYPFGRFNRESLDVTKRTFRAACTTVLQRAAADPLHALPRVDMYYIRTRGHLDQLLKGRLDHYLLLRRVGRTVRRALAPRAFAF